MELDTLRDELEQQRRQSSEKLARLQKEVDAAKTSRDGEVASLVAQETSEKEIAVRKLQEAEDRMELMQRKLRELEDGTMMKANEAMVSLKRAASLEEQLAGTRDELQDLRRLYQDLQDEKGGGDEMVSALKQTSLELTRQIQEMEASNKRHVERCLEAEATTERAKQERSGVQARLEEVEASMRTSQAESDAAMAKLIAEAGEAQEASADEISSLRQQLATLQAEKASSQAEFESAIRRAAELEEENAKVCEEKDIVARKHADQAQQHKLNERKNVKTIKELKLQMSRMKKDTDALTQTKASLEEEVAEKEKQLDEITPLGGGSRLRSATVGSEGCGSLRGSMEYAPVGEASAEPASASEPNSLEEVNARLGMQLQEVLVELEKKETMLQEYLKKQPTGGQTTLEMDMMRERQEEAEKATGLRALFRPRQEMVEKEVYVKLKGVLEETLLENIRLKGDLDTMGREVAALKGD